MRDGNEAGAHLQEKVLAPFHHPVGCMAPFDFRSGPF
jgi:hypothetical protein